MRSETIDVSGMGAIEDLYNVLENQALLLKRNYALTDLLVAYRNKDIPDEEKQYAQWELECFLFTLSGSKVFSYSYSTGKNIGEIQQFPSLDDYQKQAFNYLKKRAAEVNNPLLRATYNYLLWKAPKGIKNRVFAVKAIAAYIKVVEGYLDLYEADKNGENHLQVSNKLENLIEIAAEVKEGLDETKALVNKILYELPNVPFYVKHSLLKHMLSASTIFKPADFSNSLSVFEDELNANNELADRFLWVTEYFSTAIFIERKIGGDIRKWYNRLGDAHAAIAARETQHERLWLKAKAYTSAIDAYRNAGNTERKKEIEQLSFELKPHIKLENVRIERSAKEIAALKTVDKYIKKECESLLKLPAEAIYASLIEGWFFPAKETIKNQTAKLKSSFDYFTVIQFDRNKNIRNYPENAAASKKFNEAYQKYLETVTLHYLYYTFVPGIRSGKLTYRNFIAFLAQHTWLGKPYIKTDLGGNEVAFNWLTLLSPAICDYFLQVQSWVWSNESYTPNFILCIDSLTLKMEGLLRNFAERLNVSTTVGGKKGTQEAYINNILDNEIIQQYFDADDIQFFKFLFTNEGGMNLRNNVAHCFYNFFDYDLDKMHLLMAALIRIAKYDIADK